MIIRKEEKKDWQAVSTLNSECFDTEAEAQLVGALREEEPSIISLVAEKNNKIIGHILFSPVTLADFKDARIMGLAPMAVARKYQKKGVGKELVKAGLNLCRKKGYGAVVVLGHPDYYPRFGFLPTTVFGITCEYDLPEEVYMIVELRPGYLKGKSGTILYHEAFNDL